MSTPVVHLSGSCSLAGKVSRVQSPPKGHENSPDVFSFLGIPYAKPPINELRFKPPQPFNPWVGQRQATEYGSLCPQDFAILEKYPFPVIKPDPDRVSEDCLYLNVWTPTLDSKAKLAVMFWIHGGAFVQGYSNMYKGTALASFHNVVFVSINYRVGPLGFLCTGDSASPGNYGMLDQIEALRWVQKYIDKFGGDPDNVTIFGESAGGMSVSLLLVSKLAEGLFKRAISQSGTALSAGMVWTPKAAALILRQKLAEIGWPAGPGEEILSHLQGQSGATITEKLGELFRPVVDGHFLLSEARGIYERSEHVQRDYLLGCNSHEGTFIVDITLPQLGIEPSTLSEPLVRIFIQQGLAQRLGSTNADKLIDVIMKEYFQGVDTVEGFQKGIADYMGDVIFVIPTIDTANFHSKTNKVYLYKYNHRPAFSRAPSWVVADHGNEVPLALGLLYLVSGVKLAPEDDVISCQMMSYWTNFAKTGDPNGSGLAEWPVYDEATRSHLVINVPLSTATHLSRDRHEFWHDTIPNIIKSTSPKY